MKWLDYIVKEKDLKIMTNNISHKISILLPCFKRAELLNLGLTSINNFKPTFDYEIIVLNDGVIDDTEQICNNYINKGLNVRHIFTGQRNLDGNIKKRVPGFALNIGLKHATGDILVLSCPEIYHLNNAIDIEVKRLLRNPKQIIIPDFIYFDRIGEETKNMLLSKLEYPAVNTKNLVSGEYGRLHVLMPFLMTVMKKEIIDIGGWDEDFTGYACEDNDLMWRLEANGLSYQRCEALGIHLYHEGVGDGQTHYENPAWCHNYKLLLDRRGIIKRNQNKEWGKLCL